MPHSNGPLDLDLMCGRVTRVEPSVDYVQPASRQLVRLVQRAGLRLSEDELRDLFDMLGLDMDSRPRRCGHS